MFQFVEHFELRFKKNDSFQKKKHLNIFALSLLKYKAWTLLHTFLHGPNRAHGPSTSLVSSARDLCTAVVSGAQPNPSTSFTAPRPPALKRCTAPPLPADRSCGRSGSLTSPQPTTACKCQNGSAPRRCHLALRWGLRVRKLAQLPGSASCSIGTDRGNSSTLALASALLDLRIVVLPGVWGVGNEHAQFHSSGWW